MKLIVRWTDNEGKEHSKEYDDEATAAKAKKWLIENGITAVDIAIIK